MATATPTSGWDRLTPGTLERLDRRSISGVYSPEATDSPDAESRRAEQLFLQDARERFRDSANAENRRRAEMLDDLRFRCGFQWRPSDVATREAQGKPSLTVNRVPGFISHVVNNMRQARPEIKVDPVADGADEEIAEIRQGIIRHIEQESRAEIAYDTAFENLCTMGLGYVRIVDEWSDERSVREQSLRLDWVSNSLTVYEDPAASKPDWSDGAYKFIVEDITLLEFRRRFGRNKAPVTLGEFTSIGDQAPFWLLGDKIRIAEYFHYEEEDETLYELADGTGVFESEFEENDPRLELIATDENGKHISRQAKRRVVMWTLMYGLGILKQRRWPGKYIPVIPFIGNQIDLDGERILVGMVRYAKESQRMFNYMYSLFVESCALAPKAPFIGDFRQFEGFEEFWKNANTSPQAYLPYRGQSIEGGILPAPQRQQAEPPIAAFVEGLKLADENMKSVFRIFDASLGQKGPQESGIAINSRKVESDLATYDWIDNFNRGLRWLGTVLNDLLQYYYNTPGRIIQILQEDLQTKPTVMNQEHEVDGQTKLYDLSRGRFAINISTGPAFATRRQEAAKSMLEMAKIFPQAMGAALPMMVRQQDWPGKDALAAQIEKTLPQELRQPDPSAPKEDPEQLKQVISQMSQQIQTLSQLVTEATAKHESNERNQEWDTFREQMRQETALAIAQLKTGSQEAQYMNEKMFAELERIRMLLAPVTVDASGKPQQAPAAAAPSPAAPPSAPAAQPSSPPASGEATPAEVSIGG